MQALAKSTVTISFQQDILRRYLGILGNVSRSFPYDLSIRQSCILLSVYLDGDAPTVKEISERLNFSKPVISRACSSLIKLGLLRRKRNKEDKRVVHLVRTVKGSVYLSEVADCIKSIAENSIAA
jgi:DNA-binding MarR family transcriptional regulator